MRLSTGTPNHRVRALLAASELEPHSDAELLSRFVATRDDETFSAIVQRHTPLVLGTARRVVGNSADADDVLQAVFLTLARKAPTLRCERTLAPWLYRVTFRVALRARKRAMRTSRVENPRLQESGDPLAQITGRELCSLIDEEIARLSERLRAPVVLCCLKGLSRDEAASRLGWSPATLKRRLAKARALLERRLASRGVTLAAALAPATISSIGAADTRIVPATVACAVGRSPVQARVEALCASPAASIKSWCLLGVAASILVTGIVLGIQPSRTPPAGKPPATINDASPPQALIDPIGDPLPPGAVARMGSARFHHGNNLRQIVVSADGTLIASQAGYGYKLWDGKTGKPIPFCKELAAQAKEPRFALVAVGDSIVALVRERNRIRAVNAMTGEEILAAPETDVVGGVAGQIGGLGLTPDGKTLLNLRTHLDGANFRSTLRVWTAATEKWTDLGGVDGTASAAPFQFSTDGKTVAFAVSNGVFEVRALPDGKLKLQVPPSVAQLVEPAAMSPDGKFVARIDLTTSEIHLWDIESGKRLPALSDQPTGTAHAVGWSPDSKTLAAAHQSNHVRLWDVAARKKIRDIQMHDSRVSDLAFSSDGKRLAVADGDGVTVIDPNSGKSLFDYGGHTYTIWAAAWSPDGKRIVSGAAYTDNVGRVWDSAMGKKLFDLRGHKYGIEATAFSPDGKLIATGSQDQTVRLWNAGTGEEVHTFALNDGMVYGMAFSPDGRWIVCGGKTAIHVLNVAGRKEERTLPHVGKLSLKIEFHPDGKRLLVRDRDAGVRTVDFASGKELARFGGADKEANAVAVSPDGRHVLTGHNDGSIKLWDSASGRELRIVAGPNNGNPDDARVMSLAYSPDGRTIAVAHGNGEVRVYELATGETRYRFTGHISAALRVVFSPTGRRLVSTGADRTLLVWDVSGPPLPAVPAAQDLDTAWADLANGDAARGFAAIRYLTDNPKKSVSYLADQLKPVAAADAKKVASLIADLESPRFAERERASKELAALGEAAATQLREANAKATSAELRQRLEPLVKALDETKLGGEALRTARVVEALERIGTETARNLLERLATGADGARLTREAKAALAR
jgi:RNA polymerase sigma factor (sigma-70 family)